MDAVLLQVLLREGLLFLVLLCHLRGGGIGRVPHDVPVVRSCLISDVGRTWSGELVKVTYWILHNRTHILEWVNFLIMSISLPSSRGDMAIPDACPPPSTYMTWSLLMV